MAKNQYNFEATVCECCEQAKNYILPIDWGTAVIVKAFAAHIRNKGINMVHPTKEMEVPAKEWTYDRAIREGVLTSTQIGNFTRARVHGLLARTKDEPGNWVLTRKGAQFLRGVRIAKLAIVEKGKQGDRSHQEGYHMPELYTCTVHELGMDASGPWEGIDFEIQEGRIVLDLPVKTQEQPRMF